MTKKFLIFIMLFPCVAFADTVLTNNLIGGCDTTQLPIANNETKLTPVFEPIEYTCSYGQFLPADTTECRPCPNGYNCNGGTYAFSKTKAQGLSEKNILTQNISNICAVNILNSVNNKTKLIPVFEPNTITITWDDGTNTIQNTCDYDGEVTLPPTPTRPGYIFNGWKVKTNNNGD